MFIYLSVTVSQMVVSLTVFIRTWHDEAQLYGTYLAEAAFAEHVEEVEVCKSYDVLVTNALSGIVVCRAITNAGRLRSVVTQQTIKTILQHTIFAPTHIEELADWWIRQCDNMDLC